MKNFKTVLCFILSALMVTSLFAAVPFTAGASETAKQISGATNDEPMSPVKSIEVDDVELVEGIDCTSNYEEKDGVNHFYPFYDCIPKFRLNLEDGTVLESDGDGWIKYNGVYEKIDITSDQSLDNYWCAGKYTASAEICGFKQDFNVTIKEGPVESVKFDDMVLYKGINGKKTKNIEDYEWTEYDYVPNITVKLKDGTTLKNEITGSYEDSSIVYNNEFYYAELSDDQSSKNEWQIGKTYTVNALIFGIPTTFKVSIEDNPVEKLETYPVTVYKGFDDYEEITDDNDSYRKYEYSPRYKLTLDDGTEYESDSNGFVLINNSTVYPEVKDDQSVKNEWGIGTHKALVTVAELEEEFDVIVKDNPAKKVEAKDIDIIKGTHMREVTSYYYEGEGDESEEYEIDWEKYSYNADYEVTLIDGTVLKSEDNQVKYNDNYYSMTLTDDQKHNARWDVGSHEVRGEIFGLTVKFKVNIIDTPIEKIEFDPEVIEVVEEKDGKWEENFAGRTYFEYVYPCPDMTVTFKDGTSVKVSGSDEYIDYQGEKYPINLLGDDQYKSSWKAGKTYESGVNMLGFDANFKVAVKSKEAPQQETTVPETTVIPTDLAFETDPVTEPATDVPATEPETTEPVVTEPATTEPATTEPMTQAPEKKTTVSIKPEKKTVYVKGTFKIEANVNDGVGITVFKSDNEKVAKVDSSGKVTALKKGKANITVINNGVSKVCKVTVKNPKLKKKPKSIKKGKSFKLKVVGKIGKVKFKSSNKKIATVSKSGKIKAKKKGKVTITVIANGKKIRFKLRIK